MARLHCVSFLHIIALLVLQPCERDLLSTGHRYMFLYPTRAHDICVSMFRPRWSMHRAFDIAASMIDNAGQRVAAMRSLLNDRCYLLIDIC